MSEEPGRDDGSTGSWARPPDEQAQRWDVPSDATAPPAYPQQSDGGFAAPDAAAPVEPSAWQNNPPPGPYAAPGPYPAPPGPYPPPQPPYSQQPPYPLQPPYPATETYPATAVPYPTTAVPAYGHPPAIYGDPGYGASSAGAAAPYNLDATGMPVPVRTDPMAGTAMGLGIGSLVLSLFTCCCWPLAAVWLVGGLVAVALGVISKRNIKRHPHQRSGASYAVTGIVTGTIASVLATLVLLLLGVGLLAGQSGASG
jgi:hypothetical protein